MKHRPTASHQYHLDSLRGIATIMVVMTHYIGAFIPYAAFGNKAQYQQHFSWETLFFYPPFGLLAAGHLAVCLFFILSGYILSYQYIGEAQNRLYILAALLKRPIRLGGVVLFTLILSACLWNEKLYFNQLVADISSSRPWFYDLWAGDFYLKDFLINISQHLFNHADIYNKSLWTIKTELYGSIGVFILLLLIGNSAYRLVALALLAIFLCKSFYQGFVLGMMIADIAKNKLIAIPTQFMRYFNVVGGAFFLYLSSYPHYASFEFVQHTVYASLPNDGDLEGGYPMLSAMLLFVLVCSNNKLKTLLEKKSLKFLGKISYGVYGVHILVIGSFSAWLFLTVLPYLNYGLAFLVVLFSGFPVILLLGYLVTCYIDAPIIKLSNCTAKKFIGLFSQLFYD